MLLGKKIFFVPALCVAFLGNGWAQRSLYVQQGPRLVGTGASGLANQGESVAISGDGNTAIVGGPNDNFVNFSSQPPFGAVWVYTRTGGVWTQQAKLVAPDTTGYVQGSYIAISADGNTVIVSGGGAKAWIWFRSGSTWTEQATLVGTGLVSPGGGYTANTVALSSSGNTAIVGIPYDNDGVGAAWIFTRTGTTWTQAGNKLVGTGAIGAAGQGASVAMSGDGNTALVGGYRDNSGTGAAWVWINNGNWVQQAKLVGSGGINPAVNGLAQAVAVSLSSDGNTALIGGPGDNNNAGAAWVFGRTSGSWTQLGNKLTGTGAQGAALQGIAVALSGDGTTALIGGSLDNNHVGASWIFKRSSGVFTQFGSKLVGYGFDTVTPNPGQGVSVSLSSDGSTAIIGCAGYDQSASQSGQQVGAAWVFVLATVTEAKLRDFRGDHLSDVLLYDPANGQEYTGLSNANGTYQYVPNPFSSGFDTIRTGDFNGDGKVDVIIYNSNTSLAYIGMSQGNGSWAFQSLFWSPNYDFVEVGDLNGDGKADVILYNSSNGTLYAGIGNGDGTFTYRYNLVSSGFTFVGVADISGDYKADLILYNNANGFLATGIGDGAGGFAFKSSSISPGYVVDAADLNGDAMADVLLYNPANGNAATGISDGAGNFTFAGLLFSPGFTSVRLADYTGHPGHADLTLYNKNTAAAYFGTNNGTGTFTFNSLFWSSGYTTILTEDVNNDGKTDIVLYNGNTGTEYTGLSNGSGTFGYTYSLWGPNKMLGR